MEQILIRNLSPGSRRPGVTLAALGVRVVTPRVERLVVDGAQVRAVELEGGQAFEMDAVVVAPRFVARTEVYEALGGERTTTPFGVQIAADQSGVRRSTVSGWPGTQATSWR